MSCENRLTHIQELRFIDQRGLEEELAQIRLRRGSEQVHVSVTDSKI
jgi:hypothetical protein